MTKNTKTKLPNVELATKDWVMKEMIDTEKRIEKAFHDQTQYLSQQNTNLRNEVSNDIAIQTRWMVGLMLTMTVAILVAVLLN